jgi:hypothetical protein
LEIDHDEQTILFSYPSVLGKYVLPICFIENDSSYEMKLNGWISAGKAYFESEL